MTHKYFNAAKYCRCAIVLQVQNCTATFYYFIRDILRIGWGVEPSEQLLNRILVAKMTNRNDNSNEKDWSKRITINES